MLANGIDTSRDQISDAAPPLGTDGLQILRWREVDSNFWSLSTLMPPALAK
jgi:hypothetical protein